MWLCKWQQREMWNAMQEWIPLWQLPAEVCLLSEFHSVDEAVVWSSDDTRTTRTTVFQIMQMIIWILQHRYFFSKQQIWSNGNCWRKLERLWPVNLYLTVITGTHMQETFWEHCFVCNKERNLWIVYYDFDVLADLRFNCCVFISPIPQLTIYP